MKRIGTITALPLLIPTLLCAQLAFVESGLDFGSRPTEQQHAGTVHLENLGTEPMLAASIFCDPGWCTVSPATHLLAPGEVLELQLLAQVDHNLHYDGNLLVEGSWGAIQLPLSIDGDYAGSAWDTTFDLSGNALKSQLLSLVSNQTVLGYTEAREQMFGDIDNQAGWVESVYTGFLLQTWGIPDHTVMNTEHTWPQSYGAEGDARSDLHHLFPCKSQINSSRGNLPFGDVVVSSSGYPQGGADRGTNAQGITVFEPRQIHKGDCARAVFYFALRYGNREGFLSLADQETVLRGWSMLDAVSTKEENRNDDIAALQQKRNPFIDEPGLLDRLASLTGDADLPVAGALAVHPTSVQLDCNVLPLCQSSFVVVNPGTGPLTLSQVLSSDPGLVLALPALPLVLAAGEGLEVEIMGEGTTGSSMVSVTSSVGSMQLPVTWSGEAPELVPPLLRIQKEAAGQRLIWDPVPGADQYRIEFRSSMQGSWLNLGLTGQNQYFLPGGGWPSPSFFRVSSVSAD